VYKKYYQSLFNCKPLKRITKLRYQLGYKTHPHASNYVKKRNYESNIEVMLAQKQDV